MPSKAPAGWRGAVSGIYPEMARGREALRISRKGPHGHKCDWTKALALSGDPGFRSTCFRGNPYGRRFRTECRARSIKPRMARRDIERNDRLGRFHWIAERTLARPNRSRSSTVRCERRVDIHLAFVRSHAQWSTPHQMMRFVR